MTPRGDGGQTGLIVSSSRSREHIDFSHSPLSTHLLLAPSPPLFISLSLQRTLHIFLFLPPLSSPPEPHFFLPRTPPRPSSHSSTLFFSLSPVGCCSGLSPGVLNGNWPPSSGSTQKPTLISVQQCNSKMHLPRCRGYMSNVPGFKASGWFTRARLSQDAGLLAPDRKQALSHKAPSATRFLPLSWNHTPCRYLRPISSAQLTARHNSFSHFSCS